MSMALRFLTLNASCTRVQAKGEGHSSALLEAFALAVQFGLRCKCAFKTWAHKVTAVLASCITRPMVMKP